MNDNYYLNDKKLFYDPNSFFKLHYNQRSKSYNIDNREPHQDRIFNYSPNYDNEDYSIFKRNAISHSTLPTKYFSDYTNNNGGNRKFIKKSFNNSIRFAPTTTTIDGANRLHSRPLNSSDPYLKDLYSNDSSQWKLHHNNNFRSFPFFKKNENERYRSYDNISSNQKSRPINLYNNSPRNLFRYIYTEPRHEVHQNHLNKHTGDMLNVDYANRKESPNFYNITPILNNDCEEIYNHKENGISRRKKSITKQYMVYFCCLSFKWPPWRIEPLMEEDTKNNKMRGPINSQLTRSRDKYNGNNIKLTRQLYMNK
uniref:Homeobox protein 2-like n=1 Tax=Strongyloides papillosus TaxID=174720 RepID=A0A0N5BGU6_STREA